MNPIAIQVALLAAAVSVGSAIVGKIVVDQKKLKMTRERISALNKKYREMSITDEEKKEMMGLSKDMMMSSFRPMMFTFIPLIAVVFGMGSWYGNAGNIIEVPVFGLLNWFWWYFIVSIIAGMGFEAIYKIWGRRK